MRGYVLALLLALAPPVAAETTHIVTVTLTAEQEAVLVEQARLASASQSPRAKTPPPPITPDALLQLGLQNLIAGWESDQSERSSHKPWGELTAHERRLACRRLRMNPCQP